MATSSITKSFVIKDDRVCDKIIKALSDTTPKKVVKTNHYEEGKKNQHNTLVIETNDNCGSVKSILQRKN